MLKALFRQITCLMTGLVVGLLFGFGLILSGMSNPAKVQNFLDLFGTWDPSLAFVMGGAILVAMPSFWLAKRMKRPLIALDFDLPNLKRQIDPPLLIGASLFGVGWGIAGICPGPALTLLALNGGWAWSFFAFMLIGMILARFMKSFAAK